MEKDSKISERLIEAHNNMRSHVLSLFEGLDENKWKLLPRDSLWSMQSTAVEILNYELMQISKCSQEQLDLVPNDITLKEYPHYAHQVSDLLINHLRKECQTSGFTWITDDEGIPSYHWIMVRTIQHGIYHAGGISVLRHFIGLQRADYAHWPAMVDSIFLSSSVPELLETRNQN